MLTRSTQPIPGQTVAHVLQRSAGPAICVALREAHAGQPGFVRIAVPEGSTVVSVPASLRSRATWCATLTTS